MYTTNLLTLVHEQTPQLLDLVRQASLAIMSIKNEADDLQIQSKDDQSPLTQADLAAHEIIVAGLAQLFPNILIVSEEDNTSHQDRIQATHYWLVDPLDGTKEFINGYDDFTVNIALICRNSSGLAEPRYGFMGIPEKELYYSGGKDLGAWKHKAQEHQWLSQPLAQLDKNAPNIYRVVTSRSHLNQATLDYIASLDKKSTLVQAGSASKFCLIAEGQADLYPRLGPICEWDIAAGQAILEGVGGHVINPNTQLPPVYGNKSDLLIHPFVAGIRYE